MSVTDEEAHSEEVRTEQQIVGRGTRRMYRSKFVEKQLVDQREQVDLCCWNPCSSCRFFAASLGLTGHIHSGSYVFYVYMNSFFFTFESVEISGVRAHLIKTTLLSRNTN